MKKALCFALLLGWLIVAPQVVERAAASASATASNSVTNTVSSGSFLLTAVQHSSDSNTGTGLALTMSGGQGFFYLKNFGTTSLKGFSLSQTRNSSTVRYCVGQEFKVGDATTCFDNTAAILVGSGTSIPGVIFATALSPGASYAFSSSFNGSAGNIVSVTVTAANINNQTRAS
jgi:hypothetical protein